MRIVAAIDAVAVRERCTAAARLAVAVRVLPDEAGISSCTQETLASIAAGPDALSRSSRDI
jgi:hypothetical protein